MSVVAQGLREAWCGQQRRVDCGVGKASGVVQGLEERRWAAESCTERWGTRADRLTRLALLHDGLTMLSRVEARRGRSDAAPSHTR